MDNFQIETAQNITITQQVAGVGERILAYLIDGIIILSYIILVVLLIDTSDLNEGGNWVFMMLMSLPVMLYFLLWELLWNGRSPGKAALDLRVVRLDGSRPDLSNYLVRWLLRIIDITLTSGSVAVVTILFNGKGQRLGDIAARTTVISERPAKQFKQRLIEEVSENYEPVYMQATVLSDRDVQEVDYIFKEALKNGHYKVIASLSDKLAHLLGVKPEEKPVDFVRTVIKDYYFLTSRL